jgi:hypothetical protein
LRSFVRRLFGIDGGAKPSASNHRIYQLTPEYTEIAHSPIQAETELAPIEEASGIAEPTPGFEVDAEPVAQADIKAEELPNKEPSAAPVVQFESPPGNRPRRRSRTLRSRLISQESYV